MSNRQLSPIIVAFALGVATLAHAETDSLNALRARYAKIKSAHVKAGVEVVRLSPSPSEPPLRGSIRFEYWADGNGFRISCTPDTSLGLVGDMEVAFDGSSSQLLETADAKLILSAGATRKDPSACPNPLFLMVQFLGEREPGCGTTCTTLNDLSDNGGTVRSHRSAGGFDEYVIDGRGSDARFLLTVDPKTSNPHSLVHFYPSGRKATEVTAVAFSQTAVGPLVSKIVGQSFDDDPASTSTGTATFTLKDLSINTPVDERLFRIDWILAKAVYDADADKFIVHPNHQ